MRVIYQVKAKARWTKANIALVRNAVDFAVWYYGLEGKLLVKMGYDPEFYGSAYNLTRKGLYIVYLSAIKDMPLLDVVLHEMTHVKQYVRKELLYLDPAYLWKNVEYSEEVTYETRKWEVEACEKAKELSALYLA